MLKGLFAAASMAAVAIASPALAAPVLGAYSTGVDATGTPQANGSTEIHYTVVGAPEGFTGALRVATSENGFPIPPWVGDNSTSAWIGPVGLGDLSGYEGNYDYRTTFSLAGFNAATASLSGLWSTDNTGVDILLNGISTGITSSGFEGFTSFTIASGFTSGINTLDFIVNNAGGPTGLRTELNLTADANTGAVPEPATWAMMLMGFGMIGFGLRYRTRSTKISFA